MFLFSRFCVGENHPESLGYPGACSEAVSYPICNQTINLKQHPRSFTAHLQCISQFNWYVQGMHPNQGPPDSGAHRQLQKDSSLRSFWSETSTASTLMTN